MSLLGSPFFFSSGAAGGDFYSYNINQSLRFEDGENPYLTKTFSSSGGTVWTFSCWVKLGTTATSRALLHGYSDGSNFAQLVLDSNAEVAMYSAIGGTTKILAHTQAVQRDHSAWYHIVAKFNATSGAEEFKVYVNGENQTLDITTALTAHQSKIGNSNANYIGNNFNQSLDFDGYMAEVNFIDGTALDADSFGETKAGIWIPKKYSGSYGTNGFYLDFANSSAIGNDASGNSNDFTVSGPDANDVMPDSPTNNFATFNVLSGPNFYGTAGPYSHGNLHMRADNTVSSFLGADSTIGVSSGKWYWEIRAGSNGSSFYPGIGIRSPSGGGSIVHYRTQTQAYINGNPSGQTLSTYTGGDIIGVALDLDSSTNTLQFYKNNVANGTTFSLTSGHEWLSITGNRYHSSTSANFGADSSFFSILTRQNNADDNGIGDFVYSPPSGFLALCTANLPNPGIDPAQNKDSEDYFNTLLYTGNATIRSITGVGFQPDFVWIKQRDTSTRSHRLNDSVRGGNKQLYSDLNNAEGTATTELTSFDSDGFSLGTANGVNANTAGYVSWNWLAGGSAVSNSEGDITSSVSANTEAGFSIVSYTGDGSTSTVGHGLSNAPEFLIFKNRDDTDDWAVSTTVIDGSNDLLYLNLTSAKADITVTTPTSSVFTVNNSPVWNESGEDYIAYCFHSVDGYCDIGSYTGNGSSDGRFINTGFRPALVIVKNASASYRWNIIDNTRDPFNPAGRWLAPNDTSQELDYTSSFPHDFTSNGFKLRANTTVMNRSGDTFVYLAIAEQPFKYANAR